MPGTVLHISSQFQLATSRPEAPSFEDKSPGPEKKKRNMMFNLERLDTDHNREPTPMVGGLASPAFSSDNSPSDSYEDCKNCFAQKLKFVFCPRPDRASSKFTRPVCGTPPIKGSDLSEDEDELADDDDDEEDEFDHKDGFEEDDEEDEEDQDAFDLRAQIRARLAKDPSYKEDDHCVFDLQD